MTNYVKYPLKAIPISVQQSLKVVTAMPRKPIELPQIEYMSILDEDAVVDKALEPKIAEEELKNIYRYMLLARRTDERMLMMQRQGRLGTFPQSSGHEAISMGSCIHLKKSEQRSKLLSRVDLTAGRVVAAVSITVAPGFPGGRAARCRAR